MSDTKFTPGPWVVDEDSNIDQIAVRIGTAVESPYCRDVSDLWACDIDESENNDQALANAHLIAAAPELYEELESLLDSLAATPELNLSSWGIETDSAKAALAKARGE